MREVFGGCGGERIERWLGGKEGEGGKESKESRGRWSAKDDEMGIGVACCSNAMM